MTTAIDRELETTLRQWVDKHLEERVPLVLDRLVQRNEARAREVALMERVVRVEEELKALREVEAVHFQTTERRFEALHREMQTRFEAMNERFEALQREMQARFEAMEKRLTFMQWFMGVGFAVITVLMTLAKFL